MMRMALTIALMLLVAIGFKALFTSPAERCLIAKAEVEVYESYMHDPEVYMTILDRRNLIESRVDEVKWCRHLTSNER